MAVGNEGFFDWSPGVYVEAACLAEEPGTVHVEKSHLIFNYKQGAEL